jgi:hypothetical protein
MASRTPIGRWPNRIERRKDRGSPDGNETFLLARSADRREKELPAQQNSWVPGGVLAGFDRRFSGISGQKEWFAI